MTIHHVKPYDGTCKECSYFAANDEPDDLSCLIDSEYTEHGWTCMYGSFIDGEREKERYVSQEEFEENVRYKQD